MNLRMLLGCVLIATVCTFSYSCKTSGNLTDQQIDAILNDSVKRDALLDKILTSSKAEACEGCGQIVPKELVYPCLQAYEDSMRQHGITLDGKLPQPLTVTNGLQITSEELFRGRELMKYLARAKIRRGWLGIGGGGRLTVKIVPGIYTPEYLNKFPNAQKNGRIGIWLITCPRDKTVEELLQEFKSARLAGKALPLDDDDDPNAFDFGGLHP